MALLGARRIRFAAFGTAAFAVALAGCASQPESVLAPAAATPGKAAPPYAPNWVSTPRLFAVNAHLSSFAATPSQLIAATSDGLPSRLVRISEDGDLEAFAPEFDVAPGTLCFLDTAPGIGPFPQGALMVGAGSDIWEMPEDGSVAVLLVTLPGADGAITGVCFDTVGNFGYNLVVLTSSGAAYRIDEQSHAQWIGTFGAGASGPSVAPPGFGRFAGHLLAAFPADSDVRAMAPDGTVSPVVRWSGVNGTFVVPDSPRAFASTASTLFLATDAGNVYRYPLRDLESRGGQVVLTTRYRSGSGLITPEGSELRTRPFSRFMGVESAAGFVRRPAVWNIAIDVQPGVSPNVITLDPMALVPVAVLSSTGFLPAILDGGALTFAGAHPVFDARGRMGSYSDVNHDGVLDFVVKFRAADLAITSGELTLQLDGTALAGDCVRGSDRAVVLAP